MEQAGPTESAGDAGVKRNRHGRRDAGKVGTPDTTSFYERPGVQRNHRRRAWRAHRDGTGHWRGLGHRRCIRHGASAAPTQRTARRSNRSSATDSKTVRSTSASLDSATGTSCLTSQTRSTSRSRWRLVSPLSGRGQPRRRVGPGRGRCGADRRPPRPPCPTTSSASRAGRHPRAQHQGERPQSLRWVGGRI